MVQFKGNVHIGGKVKHKFNPLILIVVLFLFVSLTDSSSAHLAERNIDPLYTKSGARPLGLGGSFLAIADDSNTVFYNPAGLARSKGVTLTLDNATSVFAGQAYPTGFGWTIGLGIIDYKISEMPYGSGKTNFNSSTLVLSFGSRLSFLGFIPLGEVWDRTDFGLSYKKVLNMSLRQTGESDKSAEGFDMDAGLLVEVNDWMKVGVVAQNFLNEGNNDYEGGFLEWNDGSIEAFSSYLKLGISMKVIGDVKSPIYMEENELSLSADFDLPIKGDSPSLAHLGAEWLYKGMWAARIGADQRLKGNEAENILTYGLGLRTLPWGFDIAFHEGLFEGDASIHLSVLYWPEAWVFVRKPREEIEKEKREEEEKKRLEEIKKEMIKEELVESVGLKDNLVTEDDSIEINAKVKPGSKVFVNGNPAYVEKDGTVKARVPLETGKNLIEMVVEYNGARMYVRRHVLKKPKVVVAEEVALDKELERIKLQEKKAKLEKERKALEEKRRKIEKEKEVIVEKKEKLKNLATLGIIDIEPEREYKLEERISRGELAMWLAKAKKMSISRLYSDPFKDVPRGSAYAPYIKAAVDAGLMKGYPDGTFRPNMGVSEKDGAEILRRFNRL